MSNEFQAEVITRLTKIETKLDDYNSIKEKTEKSYNQSIENKEDILEINEKLKWITRTITGAIITGIIGIIFVIVQVKMGVK